MAHASAQAAPLAELHSSEDVQMTASSAPQAANETDHFAGADAVMVDDDFDWEALTGAYKGRKRIERLLFLSEQAPRLRVRCSTAALQLITSDTRDVGLYHRALLIRNTRPEAGSPLLPSEERMAGDTEWCEKTERNNRHELEKLDLELRNYLNNLIKESIRMGYRDLGDHLRATGNLSEASKYYGKTREYCSTNEHLVEMCLNMIEVSLDLHEYSAVGAYVSKAEGLLETYNPHAAAAAAAAAASSTNRGSGASGVAASKGGPTSGADAIGALFRAGGSSGSTSTPASLSAVTGQFQSASGMVAAQRDVETRGKRHVRDIQARLHVAHGLALFGLGRYQQAARCFLEVPSDAGDVYNTMASRSDVAKYMILCSLAMMDRKDLKALVIDRSGINAALEHDLRAQQLLESFYACDYRRSLDLLDQGGTHARLDPTLSIHYSALCRHIIQRAVRQFVQPFDTLRLSRLASSLGWQGAEGEARVIDELIPLIQTGEIEARLDVSENLLHTNKSDPRQILFHHALSAGRNQTMTAKRVMLRVSLLQNGLIAKSANLRSEPTASEGW